jgi:hypothetical protein
MHANKSKISLESSSIGDSLATMASSLQEKLKRAKRKRQEPSAFGSVLMNLDTNHNNNHINDSTKTMQSGRDVPVMESLGSLAGIGSSTPSRSEDKSAGSSSSKMVGSSSLTRGRTSVNHRLARRRPSLDKKKTKRGKSSSSSRSTQQRTLKSRSNTSNTTSVILSTTTSRTSKRAPRDQAAALSIQSKPNLPNNFNGGGLGAFAGLKDQISRDEKRMGGMGETKNVGARSGGLGAFVGLQLPEKQHQQVKRRIVEDKENFRAKNSGSFASRKNLIQETKTVRALKGCKEKNKNKKSSNGRKVSKKASAAKVPARRSKRLSSPSAEASSHEASLQDGGNVENTSPMDDDSLELKKRIAPSRMYGMATRSSIGSIENADSSVLQETKDNEMATEKASPRIEPEGHKKVSASPYIATCVYPALYKDSPTFSASVAPETESEQLAECKEKTDIRPLPDISNDHEEVTENFLICPKAAENSEFETNQGFPEEHAHCLKSADLETKEGASEQNGHEQPAQSISENAIDRAPRPETTPKRQENVIDEIRFVPRTQDDNSTGDIASLPKQGSNSQQEVEFSNGVSDKATALEEENQKLKEKMEALRGLIKVKTLEDENQRLKEQLEEMMAALNKPKPDPAPPVVTGRETNQSEILVELDLEEPSPNTRSRRRSRRKSAPPVRYGVCVNEKPRASKMESSSPQTETRQSPKTADSTQDSDDLHFVHAASPAAESPLKPHTPEFPAADDSEAFLWHDEISIATPLTTELAGATCDDRTEKSKSDPNDKSMRRSRRTAVPTNRFGTYVNEASPISEIKIKQPLKPKDTTVGKQKRKAVSSKPPKAQPGKKQRTVKAAGGNDPPAAVQNDVNNDGLPREEWTDEEVGLLRNAHKEIDPKSYSFWDDIAEKLEGRSSSDCREKWFSHNKTPIPKERKRAPNGPPAHGDIAALFEDDDIFNSTPMRALFSDEGTSTDNAIHRGAIGDLGHLKFGSAIKVKGTNNLVGGDTTKPGYKTYLKGIKRDAGKVTKQRALKKKKGAPYLQEKFREGDAEMNCQLSPGGTLKVKSLSFGDDLDDAFLDDQSFTEEMD